MGIVYVAAPGPIGIETLRRGLRGGIAAALAVQGGSALGLIFYAALALLGAGALLQQAARQPVPGLGGMVLLITLGIMTIRDGRDLVVQASMSAPGGPSTRSALGAGAMLSLANPLDVVFWLSIGGGLLQRQQGPLFLGAFALGCLVASLLLALFAAFWQSRLTGRSLQAVSWVCGLTLIVFGLQLGLGAAAQTLKIAN